MNNFDSKQNRICHHKNVNTKLNMPEWKLNIPQTKYFIYIMPQLRWVMFAMI